MGKAGHTLVRRLIQHEWGFRSSTTGRRNARLVREFLDGDPRDVL